MLGTNFGGDADAACAAPGFDIAAGLVESHRLSGSVARTTDAEGIKVLAVDGTLDGRIIKARRDQAREGRIVEQRDRRLLAQSAGKPCSQPFAAVVYHTQRIRTVDMIDMEVLPHRHQLTHTLPEV